ncbi:uncharacterized protein VDAG_09189 [Verticillium dahliae VdLs.17]|uniref:Aminoglycoside phosphotransferase domain-containing protein n=1 Tax=Verticillium dahliae (strain VdLs.17 / ATCC MYA-4575 / FGSC 10137) TaxID=498257 RepID=G2XFR5_VERDV|nr:uncharacterized protein VDAG_09189 [Verticillium dahliae VdLs.17]EGY18663.1 hypothetical protein VDAG_09189 [Verticillium dahliae VdLs.17]KAH6705871.1 kinase-like domain-containing protein [Verticillium dahliae]
MDPQNIANLPSQPTENRVLKANHKTPAARYNIKVLRALQHTLKGSPEADLASLLPSTYSKKLQSFKDSAVHPSTSATGSFDSKPSFLDNDVRSRIDAADQSMTLVQLSSELNGLLQPHKDLSTGLVNLLANSEVLYESAWAASIMVFRVSENLVVKVTVDERSTLNEHRSLAYLQQHQHRFPAPRPHGVVRLGQFCLLFTSFIPGITLEKAWSRFDNMEKTAISNQLDTLVATLRLIPFPENTTLGGVLGGGCKDARRGIRLNSEPIFNVKQFEDFIFAGSETASPLYTNLLRSLMPSLPATCVFSHGDLRPANIMVCQREDGSWRIVGIIDWESSGFYPEYWDCVKATNNLTPREQVDWYSFLPDQISPHRYPTQWLVDRLWDRSMVNG